MRNRNSRKETAIRVGCHSVFSLVNSFEFGFKLVDFKKVIDGKFG